MNAKTVACLSGVLMFGTLAGAHAATVTFDSGNMTTPRAASTLVYTGDWTDTSKITIGTVATDTASPNPSGNHGYVDAEGTYAYLTAGKSVTITIAGGADYLGLAWGSVDNHNRITFYDMAGNEIAQFYGNTLVSSSETSVNDPTKLLSIYANFTSDTLIGKVLLEDLTGYNAQGSFEFDNVRIATAPLPAAISLFGFGLVGLGMTGWRKRRKSAD